MMQAVTDEDGTIVVSDSYGIAWGLGDSVDRAVADWQTAAREILEMLDHEPHLSDALVARQEILRSWIR